MSLGIGLGLSPSLRYKTASGGSFSPSDISNMFGWYDAALGITLNGSDVSNWADQSGEGNDISQATAIDQPFYDTSGALPFITFDGLTEWLAGPTGAISQPITITGVLNVAQSGAGMVWDGIKSTELDFQVKTPDWDIDAGTELSGGTTDDEVTHIYVATYNGVFSSLYVGGGSKILDGDAGTNGMTGFTLGAAYWGGWFAGGATGGMKAWEVANFNKVLTSSEINQMGNYYNDKFSIAWTDVS